MEYPVILDEGEVNALAQKSHSNAVRYERENDAYTAYTALEMTHERTYHDQLIAYPAISMASRRFSRSGAPHPFLALLAHLMKERGYLWQAPCS
jgi:hypothetical protein